jgi:hypothetical protein
MTWPARTWVTAELVTATIMNAYIRDPMTQVRSRAVVFGFGDTNGDIILTGVKGYVELPFSGTFSGWTLLGDAAGSMVIDVWRRAYATSPPTVADTIAGSELPTLTSQQKNQDLALSTWNLSFTAGDILGFNVNSCSGIKQATLTLRTDLS